MSSVSRTTHETCLISKIVSVSQLLQHHHTMMFSGPVALSGCMFPPALIINSTFTCSSLSVSLPFLNDLILHSNPFLSSSGSPWILARCLFDKFPAARGRLQLAAVSPMLRISSGTFVALFLLTAKSWIESINDGGVMAMCTHKTGARPSHTSNTRNGMSEEPPPLQN